MNLDGLSKALDGVADQKPAKEKRLLSISDLCQPGGFIGTIFFADQTVSKVGCGLLVMKSSIEVIKTWTIETTPTGEKGYNDYEQRADELARWFDEIFKNYSIDLVAHETAPMGGGKLSKPESSLSAAMVIRSVAICHRIPAVSMHARHVKSVVTGNVNAEKREVKAAIERLLPVVTSGLKPWNQDISDGLALGLVAAKEWTP